MPSERETYLEKELLRIFSRMFPKNSKSHFIAICIFFCLFPFLFWCCVSPLHTRRQLLLPVRARAARAAVNHGQIPSQTSAGRHYCQRRQPFCRNSATLSDPNQSRFRRLPRERTKRRPSRTWRSRPERGGLPGGRPSAAVTVCRRVRP